MLPIETNGNTTAAAPAASTATSISSPSPHSTAISSLEDTNKNKPVLTAASNDANNNINNTKLDSPRAAGEASSGGDKVEVESEMVPMGKYKVSASKNTNEDFAIEIEKTDDVGEENKTENPTDTNTSTTSNPNWSSQFVPPQNPRSLRSMFIDYFDIYGLSAAPSAEYDPKQGPKTICGAIFGLLSIVIVLGLYGFFLYNFIRLDNVSVVLGDEVIFNVKDCEDKDSAKQVQQIYKGENPVWDLPSLDMIITSEILFFEEVSPSLQKIEVNDNIGYNPYYSNTDASVKDTRSVHQHIKVPWNSFSQKFTDSTTPNAAEEFDVQERIAIKSGHSFTSEPLKAIYSLNNILDENKDFFPHTAHMYARFSREQMKRIKKCQLQTQFVNAGVLSSLDSAGVASKREYQTAANFPSLITDNFLWLSDNFIQNPKKKGSPYSWKYGVDAETCEAWGIEQKEFDTLYLSKAFTQADFDAFRTSTDFGPKNVDIASINSQKKIEESKYNSWHLGFSYVNNMIQVTDQFLCDGRGDLDFAFGAATPISLSDTTVNIDWWDEDSEWPKVVPFTSVLTSVWGQEIVTVTNVVDAVWDGSNVFEGLLDDDDEIDRRRSLPNNGFKSSTGTIVRGIKKIDHSKSNDLLLWFTENYSTKSYEELESAVEEGLDLWKCSPNAYWADDGVCDCDCGAYDPDCGTLYNVPQEVIGCSSSQSCSLSGICVDIPNIRDLYFASDTGMMLVSKSCTELIVRGEEQLIGYVGTMDSFAGGSEYGNSAAAGSCGSCPGDTLYKNRAQLDAGGDFTCNYAAKGISRSSSSNLDTLNGVIVNKVGSEGGWLKIDVFSTGTAFPVYVSRQATDNTTGFMVYKPVSGVEYKVSVSTGDGNSELLTVINCTAANAIGLQTITVAKKKGKIYLRPSLNHGSVGVLLGAISPSSDRIYVEPLQGNMEADPDLIDGVLSFDKKGPYTVLALNGEEISISSATPTDARNSYQILTVGAPSEKTIGTISTVYSQLSFGDTTLKIKAVGFGRSEIQTELAAAGADGYPALIRVGLYSEILYITDVTASGWTCAMEYFNDGEWCDCNCGIYDPDCGDPQVSANFWCEKDGNVNPATYYGNKGYCVYPAATCTDVKPSSATPTTANTHDLFVETITLAKRLTADWSAGAIFETSMFYDENDEIVQKDIEIASQFSVDVFRESRAYYPADRSYAQGAENTISPDAIEVDVSVFIVPDRPSFATVDLCPKESNAQTPEIKFTMHDWDKWQVKKGREMKVDCVGTKDDAGIDSLGLKPFDSKECLNVTKYKTRYSGNFRSTCIDAMPPTHTFKYEVKKPMNNIWDMSWSKKEESDMQYAAAGLLNPQEFAFEIEHVYTFAHDGLDDRVENDMASGGGSHGDIDQNQFVHLYTGAKNYRGLGKTGSSGANLGVPANNPYYKPTITIQPSAWAVEDLVSCKPKFWPWETTLAKNRINKFKPIVIDNFPVEDIGGQKGQLLLEPGYKYIFSVDIGFYPRYNKTQFFDFQYIDAFSYELANIGVVKQKTDYFLKQQARVQYEVNVNSGMVQHIMAHNSSVDILMAQLGSAIAYLSIGFVLLKFYQKTFKFNESYQEWAVTNNSAEARLHVEGKSVNVPVLGKKEEEEDEEEKEAGEGEEKEQK